MPALPKTATGGADGEDPLTYGDGWLDAIRELRVQAGCEKPIHSGAAQAMRRAANEGDTGPAGQALWRAACQLSAPRGRLTVRQLIGELAKCPDGAFDLPVQIVDGDGDPELDVTAVSTTGRQDEVTGEVDGMTVVLWARPIDGDAGT